MSLIAYPPARPETDYHLDALVKNETREVSEQRPRRTLPAEWEPQSAVQLTWPHAATDWAPMLQEVTKTYLRLAYEIATRQTLIIVTPEADAVSRLLQQQLPSKVLGHIHFVSAPTDDTWARDHGFLTLMGTGGCEFLDFRFNGWGGKFGADRDNAINRALYATGLLQGHYVDCLDFELEGGSIESDGRGTLLTTRACLLNANRNAPMSDAQREALLLARLGAQRVLWLSHGALEGDDTDAHIDTLARLCPADTIVYVKCEDATDAAHYANLGLMEQELQALRTAEGKPYRLIPVPLPAPIYDAEGQRLPATYANFLIMNTAVLVPTYKQPTLDERAMNAIASAFPGRDIVGIDCRPLIYQHGSLHCATMQYPRGAVRAPEA